MNPQCERLVKTSSFLGTVHVFAAESRFSFCSNTLKFFTHPRCLFNEEICTPDRFNIEAQQGFRVRFSEIKWLRRQKLCHPEDKVVAAAGVSDARCIGAL